MTINRLTLLPEFGEFISTLIFSSHKRTMLTMAANAPYFYILPKCLQLFHEKFVQAGTLTLENGPQSTTN